jgi:hypothetical protein
MGPSINHKSEKSAGMPRFVFPRLKFKQAYTTYGMWAFSFKTLDFLRECKAEPVSETTITESGASTHY